ncbi:TetR/AcrR family transcriptional regulator [Nonomuraea polychroma]|uniref:TetR/AcrR family transcriptional regulator n=1 Tax=Nonomuraea polychroma TaxID=46176 RepID=UPI003D92F23E
MYGAARPLALAAGYHSETMSCLDFEPASQGSGRISSRTLWRYFPSKESCVRPLLTGGLDLAMRCLRSWRAEQDVADLLDAMRWVADEGADDRAALLNLVRLTGSEPGLRAVWLEAHREAEPVFAAVLAERAGLPGPDLDIKVQAAMLNVALRTGVEHYAAHTDPAVAEQPGLLEATVGQALRAAARGFSHERPSTACCATSPPPPSCCSTT